MDLVFGILQICVGVWVAIDLKLASAFRSALTPTHGYTPIGIILLFGRAAWTSLKAMPIFANVTSGALTIARATKLSDGTRFEALANALPCPEELLVTNLIVEAFAINPMFIRVTNDFSDPHAIRAIVRETLKVPAVMMYYRTGQSYGGSENFVYGGGHVKAAVGKPTCKTAGLIVALCGGVAGKGVASTVEFICDAGMNTLIHAELHYQHKNHRPTHVCSLSEISFKELLSFAPHSALSASISSGASFLYKLEADDSCKRLMDKLPTFCSNVLNESLRGGALVPIARCFQMASILQNDTSIQLIGVDASQSTNDEPQQAL